MKKTFRCSFVRSLDKFSTFLKTIFWDFFDNHGAHKWIGWCEEARKHNGETFWRNVQDRNSHTHLQTDRQTDRHTERQADRQTDMKIDRQTGLMQLCFSGVKFQTKNNGSKVGYLAQSLPVQCQLSVTYKQICLLQKKTNKKKTPKRTWNSYWN